MLHSSVPFQKFFSFYISAVMTVLFCVLRTILLIQLVGLIAIESTDHTYEGNSPITTRNKSKTSFFKWRNLIPKKLEPQQQDTQDTRITDNPEARMTTVSSYLFILFYFFQFPVSEY